MEPKIGKQMRPSTTIQYVRSYDSPNDMHKPNHCLSFAFQYKTSFIAALFSIVLIACFIMMMIYVTLQSENYFSHSYSEPAVSKEDPPITSQLSLSMDPKTKDFVMALATDEKSEWSDIHFVQDDFEKTRLKRQVPNHQPFVTDCRGKQEECKIILDGLRGLTKSMHKKMDRFQYALTQQGIIKNTDPKDAVYRKVFECLQCRKTINQNHDDSDHNNVNIIPSNDVNTFMPGYGRDTGPRHDRISDLLPFLESHAYADDHDHDDGGKDSDEQTEKKKGEERTERVPKNPPPIMMQVLDSVTTRSKVRDDTKITEMLHDTSIVEKETREAANQQQFPRGANQYMYNYRPYNVPGDAVPREDSQVTRNVEATPIILPTAETTKTSQQIQFTPQNGDWPSVPVCFYGPPSSSASNSYSNKQGVPFFIPYGSQQGPSNQEIKFFGPNGQPMPFFPSNIPPSMMNQQFQSNLPPSLQFPRPPSSPQFSPSGPPQFPMPPQAMGQSNRPYYCTYMPTPSNYQQQQQYPFPPGYPMADFQRDFVGKSKDGGETETKTTEDRKQTSEVKSTYDASDEKYYATECAGFWCKEPYRKCIAFHERCDGKVDCMGAEDEIDCPYIGYYSNLRNAMSASDPGFEQWRRMNSPYVITRPEEEYKKTMTTSKTEDGRQQAAGQGMDMVMPTPYIPLPPPTAQSPVEVDTTTNTITVPDMPQMFTCKRIMEMISMDKRCDGKFDCQDASDEENCTCKDYLRRDYPSVICDGHVDCYDGSDEKDCVVCNESQYHCYRSGTCIPKRKRCDQTMDCSLNEDELDCFALTDGHQINLDLDKHPVLNREGLLTRYDNGGWRPSCFKSEYRDPMKRMSAGQKICEYLGFKNVDYINEVLVNTTKLPEKMVSTDPSPTYEYMPYPTRSSRETNKTCYGLYIRCKPTLDRKLNVHLKIDPKTQERSYTWPWEASIFVDGKYHCSSVLLDNNMLLSSSKCSEDINLNKNYTTALMGVSSPDLPFDSPYEQVSPIVSIKPVKNSDASLFRLKDPVNMTRYVQPIYMEKRIFPPATNDACIAIGVNENHERKMKFLQPVEDCPKCHRCYIEKSETSTCAKANSTSYWSGNVVCLSDGGWYPAAVFHDKDENCGFASKQILNSIDYIQAHLSQAIDEKVQPPEVEPPCDGVRCSLGQCVPWERVCNGVRECHNGADESSDICQTMKDQCEKGVMECKCSRAELRCGNGKCIPKEMFCDGKIDCADGTDEPTSCSCGEYLKLTEPRRVCDGRRHCYDKSDEDYHHCLCKDSSFKCEKSPYNGTVACIPQDFVCDGEVDCPQGEDELESVCWTIKSDKNDPKNAGEVMERSFGMLHSACFPRPIQSQREVTNTCSRLGYTSGMLIDGSQLSDSQFVPRNDFYMFQLNNHTWLTMRDDVSFGVWKKPETNCYRLFVHCF